jgi:hypothetical protein
MMNMVNCIANTETGLVLMQGGTYLLVETALDLDQGQGMLKPHRPGAMGEDGGAFFQ